MQVTNIYSTIILHFAMTDKLKVPLLIVKSNIKSGFKLN